MLHVNSATLELGLPSDTKGLESLSNNAAVPAKKGFSQVFDRQINADGEDKLTKKAQNELNKTNSNEKETSNESIRTSEPENIENKSSELPNNIKPLENKQADDVTDNDKNTNTIEFSTVKNNEFVSDTEKNITQDEENFSIEFIHLLSASEKLLPQHNDDSAVADVSDYQKVEVLKQNESDIESTSKLRVNANGISEGTIDNGLFNQLNSAKDSVQNNTPFQNNSIEKTSENAALSFVKQPSSEVLNKLNAEPIKGANKSDDISAVKLSTSIGTQYTTPNVLTEAKSDDASAVKLSSSIGTQPTAPDILTAGKSDNLAPSSTVSQSTPTVLPAASLIIDEVKEGSSKPEVIKSDLKGEAKLENVTSQGIKHTSFLNIPNTENTRVESDELIKSDKTLQKSQVNVAIKDPEKLVSQAANVLQIPAKEATLDDKGIQPVVVNTVNNRVDESLVKNEIKSIVGDDALQTNIKQSLPNEAKFSDISVADNAVEQKLPSSNASSKVVNQLDSVSQTLAEAENHRESVKQNTILNENAEQYKFSEKAKGSEVEKDAVKSAQSDVNKVTTVDTNENTTVKNTISPLLNPQINDSIVNNDSDSRYSDVSANLQTVDGFSNRFVAENIQQNKLNVNQQVETIHINDKNFSESVKEKVLFAISQKLQRIDIQLDPPELGNVHVRVNLQNEVAAVNFVVQHQQTKESLEQHMDKLKDMLADSGVNVGDANVEQQNQGDRNSDEGANGDTNGSGTTDTTLENNVITGAWAKDSAEGVDFYA